ncbi:hypothetical protein AAH994_08540 [Weeksellaceae bacterium A-14]|uniref:hypothetical protein n=1 Tax=Daejeonia sp. YH14 TaxID=3439042 RepID=UPI0031E49CFB
MKILISIIMKTKKNYVAYLCAAGLTFALMSCNKVSEKRPEGAAKTSSDYEDHLISRKLTKRLASEYEKGNYAVINAKRKEPDAREAYFDLEVLEGYIAYVKKRALEKGVKDPSIKIVLGQYPKDSLIDRRENTAYKGYQMMFLVPAENPKFERAQVSVKADALDDIEGLDFAHIVPPERK